MPDRAEGSVAIVDYGLGNLYSVKHACESVGLQATVTSDKRELAKARAVILPGVGAFGEAMQSLARLDLVEPLRDVAATGIPLVGICLGMQLLMSESQEFGRHRGLNVIEGEVVRLEGQGEANRRLKVPQVGWNRIWHVQGDELGELSEAVGVSAWNGSLLEGVGNGAYMYFVHSFYCKPASDDAVLSKSRYGDIIFPSTVRCGNVIGVQFHPERSGGCGLQLYRNVAASIHGLN